MFRETRNVWHWKLWNAITCLHNQEIDKQAPTNNWIQFGWSENKTCDLIQIRKPFRHVVPKTEPNQVPNFQAKFREPTVRSPFGCGQLFVPTTRGGCFESVTPTMTSRPLAFPSHGSSIQEPPIDIISGRALTRRHHRCLLGPGLALFDARAGYHIE